MRFDVCAVCLPLRAEHEINVRTPVYSSEAGELGEVMEKLLAGTNRGDFEADTR